MSEVRNIPVYSSSADVRFRSC